MSQNSIEVAEAVRLAVAHLDTVPDDEVRLYVEEIHADDRYCIIREDGQPGEDILDSRVPPPGQRYRVSFRLPEGSNLHTYEDCEIELAPRDEWIRVRREWVIES